MNTLKYILLTAVISALSFTAQAELILWDNTGSPSTGDNLDGIDTTPTVINVEELLGLTMTITSVGGSANSELNATATSLGINGDGDSDTDTFESAVAETFTFNFNQNVSITQIDFTNFDSGESFSFGGTAINFADLSNASTDVIDFGSPLNIAASTPITVTATAGSIGIEALTLTAVAVPEPSSLALFAMGIVTFLSRKRRK